MEQEQIDALYATALRSGAPSVQVLACKLLRGAAMADAILPGAERTLPLPTIVRVRIGISDDPACNLVAGTWKVIVDLLDALRDAANTQVVG